MSIVIPSGLVSWLVVNPPLDLAQFASASKDSHFLGARRVLINNSQSCTLPDEILDNEGLLGLLSVSWPLLSSVAWQQIPR